MQFNFFDVHLHPLKKSSKAFKQRHALLQNNFIDQILRPATNMFDRRYQLCLLSLVFMYTQHLFAH